VEKRRCIRVAYDRDIWRGNHHRHIVRYETMNNPTSELFTELTRAYDYFNMELFDNRLPSCMIVMHRHRTANGYFWADQWANKDTKDKASEIAINPDTLRNRSAFEVLSTLVHEMCHLEQWYFGKSSRNGYHNKQWGDYMRAVGLYPSASGEEGGKETGQQMTHYVIDGGAYDVKASAFLKDGFSLDWFTKPKESKAAKKKKAASKTKYTCPDCDANAWGKPELNIACMDCITVMEVEE
jgi:hypothetical protein